MRARTPIRHFHSRRVPTPVIRFHRATLCLGAIAVLSLAGCEHLVQVTDREVAAAIEKRQRTALDYRQPAPVESPDRPEPGDKAYEYSPNPSTTEVPADFKVSHAEAPAVAASQPQTPTAVEISERVSQPMDRASSGPASAAGAASRRVEGQTPDEVVDEALADAPVGATEPLLPTASGPTRRFRESVFALTDALAYAQQYRREYQSAKEDLYLITLALTLERHLWTPIFASNIRQVYGNFGEITHNDQATRFMADLSVAQRLPYGGEFTAAAVATLIRDVKQSITAQETGQIALGLNIPFLRGAGHVAQEELIQLERNLTYAVRDFERFRRSQLVLVAQDYFDLLRSKQEVLDSETSYRNAIEDFARAAALEDAGTGSQLDTRRAEQRMLSEETRLEALRESFRAQTDRFKLTIGMPVDDPIGLDDLEDIDSIEAAIAAGRYPLLLRPEAAGDEKRAIEVALERRMELLNRKDQIDDARRGVSIAKNALLPDLGWNSTLTFDTDPNRYNIGAFTVSRATWRTEMLLSLPLDRFKERNDYRASLIDVRRAQRTYQDQIERTRAEVRRAVNQIRLQERLVEIQQRNLEVAELRREFARIQFYDGDIGNRDLVEAEDEWTDARNQLNQAKTARWAALLDFRLATDTLQIDEPTAALQGRNNGS